MTHVVKYILDWCHLTCKCSYGPKPNLFIQPSQVGDDVVTVIRGKFWGKNRNTFVNKTIKSQLKSGDFWQKYRLCILNLKLI